MSKHEVDVVVIGLGPGGEYAAGELAEAGLTVAGVEDSLVGGECPYWGCVPSKMMIRAANLVTEGRRIPGMAGASAVQPDWAPVARRIRDEATDGWDDKVAADRFTGKGGLLFRGHGKIIAPGRVAVGDTDEVVQPAVLSRLYGRHVDVIRVHGRILVVAAPEGVDTTVEDVEAVR